MARYAKPRPSVLAAASLAIARPPTSSNINDENLDSQSSDGIPPPPPSQPFYSEIDIPDNSRSLKRLKTSSSANSGERDEGKNVYYITKKFYFN